MFGTIDNPWLSRLFLMSKIRSQWLQIFFRGLIRSILSRCFFCPDFSGVIFTLYIFYCLSFMWSASKLSFFPCLNVIMIEAITKVWRFKKLFTFSMLARNEDDRETKYKNIVDFIKYIQWCNWKLKTWWIKSANWLLSNVVIYITQKNCSRSFYVYGRWSFLSVLESSSFLKVWAQESMDHLRCR